jgi:putative addiction module component (TIGR02574 family)
MVTTLTLDSFIAEAMQFGPDSRLELAERLVASVPADAEIESAQLDEVHWRMEEVNAGRMAVIAGEDALRQVREAVLGRA